MVHSNHYTICSREPSENYTTMQIKFTKFHITNAIPGSYVRYSSHAVNRTPRCVTYTNVILEKKRIYINSVNYLFSFQIFFITLYLLIIFLLLK